MSAPHETRILRRDQHNISRQNMDPDALKVMYRLTRNGHKAYLVGGAVRDLLLEKTPKDYDIGTDATPEEVLELFRNSRVIGRRFPIVHVIFGNGKVMEVSTFRASEDESDRNELPSDQDSTEEKELLEAEAGQIMDENGHENADDEAPDDQHLADDNGNGEANEPDPRDRDGENDREDDGENDREDDRIGEPLRDDGDGDNDEAAAALPDTPAGRIRRQNQDTRRREFFRGRRGRRSDRGRSILQFCDPQQYGSPEEDARRRDLTINGLFYDVEDFRVIDHVGGLADLEAGVIRAIGDPMLRLAADPVRMIRAIRHSGRNGFTIEPATWQAILTHGHLLSECSKARVLEEFYRDLRGGASFETLRLLRKSGLLGVFLPALLDFLPDFPDHPDHNEDETIPLAWRRLQVLDRHIAEGETFTPAFLLSLLFAFPILDYLEAEAEKQSLVHLDFGRQAYRFLKPLTMRMGAARRDTERLFLISISQRRLGGCRHGQPIPAFFANKPYFEEALQLFLFDLEARGEEAPELKFSSRKRKRSRNRSRRSRSRRNA